MNDSLDLLVGIEVEIGTEAPEPDEDEFEPQECDECGHTPEYYESEYERQLENWIEAWHYDNEGWIDPYTWAEDYVTTPEGWTLGEDASCGLEYRFSNPTPLADAPELLCDLVNKLADCEHVQLHNQTGMHIHLDARSTSAVHVDPVRAWELWQNGWADTAWALCDNYSDRRRQSYCAPMDLSLTWEQIRGGFYRNVDINFTNFHQADGYGYTKCTVELRLWDTTINEELNIRRLEWVNEFVTACITPDAIPFDPFSEAAAWERFCQ